MVRCKVCKKAFRSSGKKGRHCWEYDNCFKCHYLGINQNMTRTIKL